MEINKIKPIICITKEDLIDDEEKKKINEILSYYKKIGYQVYYNYELDDIRKIFKGKTTVFTGQTGAGKSSLFNKLDSSLNFDVGEVSISLGRGKHTTRFVELISLFDGKLVDTPGFSSIDLSIYDKQTIMNAFIEFKQYECKYKDCMHTNEKKEECAIKQAVDSGEILNTRYENYLKFLNQQC